MRQSGSGLRKLIRSGAAAGFWSGAAYGEEQFLGTKPELAAPRHRYWDTPLMGPEAPVALRWRPSEGVIEIPRSGGDY